MTHAYTLDEIKAELGRRVAELCEDLAPGGDIACGEWTHPEHDSFKVNVKSGRWKHFAADRTGSLLDLIAYLATGDDFTAAIKWALDWLGWDATGAAATRRPRKTDAELRADRERRETSEREETAKKRGWARALWLNGTPALAGTWAERYLAGRGLPLDKLRDERGELPGALRFRPAVTCDELHTTAPALLALISGPRGDGKRTTYGCHRTWLFEHEGEIVHGGRAGALKNPKKALGPFTGGCIPLWRGAQGTPFDQAEGTVVVAEGIEDCLTLAIHAPEERIAASVTLSHLRHIAFAPGVELIKIAADRDAKPDARTNLENTANHLLDRGLDVAVVYPPGSFKDWNAWHLWWLENEARREAARNHTLELAT